MRLFGTIIPAAARCNAVHRLHDESFLSLMKTLFTLFSEYTQRTLFAAHAANPRGAADRAPADNASKAAAPRRRALLIVEDNPSTRILLVYMLKALYDVTPAAGYDEALRLIDEGSFDGLVLDINLCEERTGVDLLHAIRAIPKYQHVPAVACTAYTSFGDRERLLESGFDRYVAKPFTKEQLRNTLTHLFDPSSHKTGSGYQA